MENSNYSLSDIAAIVGGKSNEGFLEGNGIIVLLIFFLMMGGFGGYGWGGAAAGAATANAITNDFLFNNLSNQIANAGTRIEGAIANTNQNIAAGFNSLQAQGYQIDRDVLAQTTAINQTLAAGFSGVNANMNAGINAVNANITDVGYKMQDCCCQIKNAVHSEGEMTRALIQANLVQDLRDKIAEKDSTLAQANLTLANAAQTQNLLNALGTYVPTSNTGCGCSY